MVTAQPIAEILGLGADVRSMQELDIAVNAGLPKRSLVLLSSRLYCDDRVANAFMFQVIPPATWKRRTTRLSQQESERIERIARALADAEYVLDDRDKARQWMSAPHRELGGETPIEAARTEIGARRVEAVLNKLFFGLPA
jgi:putative toxin-antitoxin system antitoxin component (TIGR02293 family)